MTRALTLLLIAQLALVAWLYWPVSDELRQRLALIPGVSSSSVESIEISDGDGQAVKLTRTATAETEDSGTGAGAAWQLASGLPVDNEKVATLLRALLEADPGYPIARSDAAATRFKVASDDYERRIALGGSSGSATAFLGSSPAFRKSYARSDGEANSKRGSADKSEIFVIELNNYDAPTQPGEWLDSRVLAQRDIESITLYGVTFRALPATGDWSRDDSAAVDMRAMKALLESLENLQVSGIARPDDEDLREAGEVLRLSVGQNGATSQLNVLNNPASERYYLISGAFSQTFDTSAYDAERLLEAAKALGGTPGDTAKQ